MTQNADQISFEAARAALEWMVELGVDVAVGDAPVDAYALPDHLAVPNRAPTPAAPIEAVPATRMARPVVIDAPDPVVVARDSARMAQNLVDLRDMIAEYDLCALKKGAKNTVFSDGNPLARVMVIGDAPDRDDDAQGKPFMGRAGHLLDRMFAAIGMDRNAPDPASAIYTTNVLPWRPPGDRDPDTAEIAQMLPFLTRHVELADPDVIVLMGNAACKAALNRGGISRLRGQWAKAFGRPVLPMIHPAYLLTHPHAKREAWADLLALKLWLGQTPG